MADNINNIVGQGAIDDINKLKQALTELLESFKKTAQEANNLESQLGGGKSLKSLMDSYAKIEEIKNKTLLVEKQIELLEQRKAEATAKRLLAEQRQIDNLNNSKNKELQEEERRNKQREKSANDLNKILDDAEKKRKKEQSDRLKEEAKAEKERLKLIKENQAIADRINKEEEKRAKSEANNTTYQNARKEFNALTIALRNADLEYQRLARSGKGSSQEVAEQRDRVKQLRDEWKLLKGELDKVENSTGGSTRPYNQMLTETNQLLRELPNFAISARTGILSISNNLPMFVEAWQRTASAIDETTDKAKGFRGALSELGRALMSWQTIVITAISLAIQFSDEIIDFVTSVSDAEKMQRKFGEATKEALGNKAKELAILAQLKYAYNNNTVALSQQNKILLDAQNSFKGYFNEVNTTKEGIIELNKEIERQKDLLLSSASEEAYFKVISELVLELTEAQKNLNIEFGNWESFISYFSEGNAMSDLKFLDNLTDKTKVYLNELKKLRSEGAISEAEFRAGLSRIREATESQEDLNLALEQTSVVLSDEEKVIKSTVTEINKKIEALRGQIKTQSMYANYTDNSLRNELALLLKTNEEYSNRLVLLQRQREEQEKVNRQNFSNNLDNKDLDVIKAETDLLKQKRNTQGYIIANQKLITAEYNRSLKALQDTYSQQFDNKNYQIELAKLNAQYNRDLEENVIKPTKKATIAKWDYQKAELAVNEAIAKTTFEIRKANLETEANVYEQIFKDETQSLQDRLNALREFSVTKENIVNAELEKELSDIENGFKRKLAIEKELGREINSIKELQSLESDKKITSEQKNFLANALNFARERVRIEQQMQKNLSDIDKESANSTEDIIMSDLQNKMNEYSTGLKASSDRVLAETNDSILALNKAREEGLISERQYWNRLEQTLKDEGDKVLIANLKFVEDFTETLRLKINSPEFQQMSKEEQKNLTEFYNSLAQASADARRKIKNNNNDLSLFEIITGSTLREGINSFIPKDLDKVTAKEAELIASTFESAFASMFDSINKMWDAYYEKRRLEIDEQEKVNDKWFKDEQNRVNSSLMGQEEKEKALQELDGQRLANEQELDRRRREIARKQAIDEKEQAKLSATLSFASAVMKIWAQFPNPIIALPITAALGVAYALQMSSINNAPIPAYEKGTPKDGHSGGVALVGEKRRELVVTPDGKLFYTPSTPTLMNLPKGSHVLPNPDSMSSLAKNEALARLGSGDVSEATRNSDILGYKLDNLSNIIRNKQENHIFLQNGELKKFVRKANTRINWVNK